MVVVSATPFLPSNFYLLSSASNARAPLSARKPARVLVPLVKDGFPVRRRRSGRVQLLVCVGRPTQVQLLRTATVTASDLVTGTLDANCQCASPPTASRGRDPIVLYPPHDRRTNTQLPQRTRNSGTPYTMSEGSRRASNSTLKPMLGSRPIDVLRSTTLARWSHRTPETFSRAYTFWTSR